MFCPKCGKQIPDGANFCPECGNRFDPVPNAVPQYQTPSQQPPNPQPDLAYSQFYGSQPAQGAQNVNQFGAAAQTNQNPDQLYGSQPTQGAQNVNQFGATAQTNQNPDQLYGSQPTQGAQNVNQFGAAAQTNQNPDQLYGSQPAQGAQNINNGYSLPGDGQNVNAGYNTQGTIPGAVPGSQPPKKKKTGCIIAAVIVFFVLIMACVILTAIFYFAGKVKESPDLTDVTRPAASLEGTYNVPGYSMYLPEGWSLNDEKTIEKLKNSNSISSSSATNYDYYFFNNNEDTDFGFVYEVSMDYNVPVTDEVFDEVVNEETFEDIGTVDDIETNYVSGYMSKTAVISDVDDTGDANLVMTVINVNNDTKRLLYVVYYDRDGDDNDSGFVFPTFMEIE